MEKRFFDIKYGNKPAQKVDIYVADSKKTVVYIHGGGIESGSKEYNALIEKLVSSGYSVVSVDYSLYPDTKFPEFIEDCALALKFAVDSVKTYGYGEEIAVFGCSAGAYISLMLMFDGRFLAKYSLSPANFTGFIIDSAQPFAHFNVLRERGEDSFAVRIDDAAPIYFLEKKDYGTKLVLITYTEDISCRKEQNEVFDKTLDAYGIKHEFYVLKGGHVSGENPDENGEIKVFPLIEKVYL